MCYSFGGSRPTLNRFEWSLVGSCLEEADVYQKDIDQSVDNV